jgi:hypothetical protein
MSLIPCRVPRLEETKYFLTFVPWLTDLGHVASGTKCIILLLVPRKITNVIERLENNTVHVHYMYRARILKHFEMHFS